MCDLHRASQPTIDSMALRKHRCIYYLDHLVPIDGLDATAELSEFVPRLNGAALVTFQAIANSIGSLSGWDTISSSSSSMNIHTLYENWTMQGKANTVAVIPAYHHRLFSRANPCRSEQPVFEVTVFFADGSAHIAKVMEETTACELVADLCGDASIGLFEAARVSHNTFGQFNLISAAECILQTYRLCEQLSLVLYLPIQPTEGDAKVTHSGQKVISYAQQSTQDIDPLFFAPCVANQPTATLPTAEVAAAQTILPPLTISRSPQHQPADRQKASIASPGGEAEGAADLQGIIRSPIDHAGGDEDGLPLYELELDQSKLVQVASRVIGSAAFELLLEHWTQPLSPGETPQQKVHELVRAAIRLGGKADALELKHIAEASLIDALQGLEDHPEIRLDTKALACDAVCGEYDAEMHELWKDIARKARVDLHDRREEWRRTPLRSTILRSGLLDLIASKEEDVLCPIFHEVALVVQTADSLATPNAIFLSPPVSPTKQGAAQLPRKLDSTLPSPVPRATLLLADKLTGQAGFSYTCTVRKGLVVERASSGELLAARIVLHLEGDFYREKRWMTPLSASERELVGYVVVVVLFPEEQLRDLLLAADRENSGAVSEQYRKAHWEFEELMNRLSVQQAALEAQEERDGSDSGAATAGTTIRGYLNPWGEPSAEVYDAMTEQERFKLDFPGVHGNAFPEVYAPRLSDRPWWSTVIPPNCVLL